MSFNPNFEVPSQRFGEVTSHDFYTDEQVRMFKIIDSFGKSSVEQTVEVDAEESIESVVSTGQYL